MLTSTRGSVSLLSSTVQVPSAARRTCTSGTFTSIRARAKRRPGFGSSARISASMSARSSASTPQIARSSASWRRAAIGRCSSSAAIAGSSRSRSRELQRQALGEAARADPDRLAGLDEAQAGGRLGGGQPVPRGDLGQRHAQVAVLLELVGDDQRRLDRRRGRAHLADLGVQMLVEGDLGGDRLEEAGVRLAAADRAGRGRRRRQLEQRVLLDLGAQVVGELEVRHPQQLDRLLQLRGHHQRLALPELDARGERHQRGFRADGQMRKLSPR